MDYINQLLAVGSPGGWWIFGDLVLYRLARKCSDIMEAAGTSV